jgi:predicted DNA-binding transcriptional regulator AlpA
MNKVLIGYDGLKQRGIRLSPRQLHRKALAGTFPKPIMIGECTKAWLVEEVDAWLEAKILERDST